MAQSFAATLPGSRPSAVALLTAVLCAACSAEVASSEQAGSDANFAQLCEADQICTVPTESIPGPILAPSPPRGCMTDWFASKVGGICRAPTDSRWHYARLMGGNVRTLADLCEYVWPRKEDAPLSPPLSDVLQEPARLNCQGEDDLLPNSKGLKPTTCAASACEGPDAIAVASPPLLTFAEGGGRPVYSNFNRNLWTSSSLYRLRVNSIEYFDSLSPGFYHLISDQDVIDSVEYKTASGQPWITLF